MPPRARRPVPTFDHLAKKKPIERRVPVITDDAPLEVLDRLRERRARLSAERVDAPAGLAAEITAAEASVEDVTVWCVFHTIGRKAYEDLMRAHPATECRDGVEGAETGKDCGECDNCRARAAFNDPDARSPYHHETFAPALIAASCVEPVMTVEQVTQLFEDWTLAEVASLFAAALEVNTTRRVADFLAG